MPNAPVVNINVVNAVGGPVKVQRKTGWLLQLLYFIFIGWWLGAAAVILAYLCFILVVTFPIGVKLINNISYTMALREPAVVLTPWGEISVQQRPFLLRALWFIVFGCWFTAGWMVLAYVLCLTIIGMPLGFWMFDRAPALLTLHKAA